MKKVALTVMAASVLVGCASQKLLKETPSGRAEGVFTGVGLNWVSSRLAGVCMNDGSMVEQPNQNTVICSKTMTGGQAVMAQMAVGNSYSTTPVQKVRFSMVPQPDGVRVVAFQWVESQMAFGQIRQQELNANHQRNDLQQLLWSLGAK